MIYLDNNPLKTVECLEFAIQKANYSSKNILI